jgi:heat shock protein HslJ
MLPRLSFYVALLCMFGVVAACSGNQGPTPAPTSGTDLAGRTFLSISATDGGVDRPLVPGTRIRLDFRATDFTASAGCNTIGGQYRLEAGRLLVDQLATTAIGCPAALGAQDAWLSTLLTARPMVALSGNALTLDAGASVLKLLDQSVADPDRPLVGTLWNLESIISGDAVSSIPDGSRATILFKADGTLTLFTGCNQGGASWSQTAAGIQVSELVLTKKACEGPTAALETAMITVLRAGPIAATIQADSLTLQAGSSGIQLRAS